MLSPNTISYLRQTPPELLLREHADYARGRFSGDGIPVIIAARNEEADLPATLLSLAANEAKVLPIVVENGSDDETAKRAQLMGAVVLQGALPYKMAALQFGVSWLADRNQLARPVLFTDADTLLGKRWAHMLSSKGESPADNTPVAVCGPAVIMHGPNKAVDSLRTINAAVKDAQKALLKHRPIARGHNMAVNFAGSGEAIEAYSTIDHKLFVGEERGIVDSVLATGGLVRRLLDIRAAVVTRGDRFTSFKDCFSTKNDDTGQSARLKLYEDDYGTDLRPYGDPTSTEVNYEIG
jgi:glycosyltransferase involved in cell wall biosynthesis